MKNRIINLALMMFYAVIATISTAISGFAASPGALDGTFDVDGKLSINLGASTADPRDVAIQPDGKIVAVGGFGSSFFVVRFNPNGSPDTTFDTDGIRITNYAGVSGSVFSVALQTDGKIIVGGGSGSNFALARFNPNGSFDTTFDTDGVLTTDFFGQTDEISAIKIQPDGKIVAGGNARTASNNQDFGIARYNLDGSLDTTFSTDGKANFDISNLQNNAFDIALQADGKIVAAGEVASNNGDFAIYRVTTAGILDTTFDTDGIVSTDIFATDSASCVAIQTDGKIIAAGRSDTNEIASMVRYNPSGSLDTTFDGDGRVTADIPFFQNELVEDIQIQADGKILATLSTFVSFNPSFTNGGLVVVRYNPNGSFDSGFGTNNGTVSIRAQPVNTELPIAIEILAGGKAVVLGATFTNPSISLARLNLDAQPTETGDFDGDGFSDFAVFRPSTTNWFVLRSSDQTVQISAFGINSDVPLDGDFDGDGRNDLAIYRPSAGQWWFQRSSDNTVFAATFGISTDKPVPGDYDKDGKTDIAIFRPSTGEWLILRSSANFTTFFGFAFGANGDIPITKQGL